MNKKTLKLFLAAALGLSLLCAAQTVNAMEKNTNLNKNLITKNENKSVNDEEISFLDDDLKEIVKKATTSFPKYQNIINKLKFDEFINLFLNKFTTTFNNDYLFKNRKLLCLPNNVFDDISMNISKSSDGKRLLVEDVISEQKYEKFCRFVALKCIKDLRERCNLLSLNNSSFEKCLNKLRLELEEVDQSTNQNKNQPPYLKTILDRILNKNLFDYRSEESNENIEEAGRVVAGGNLEEGGRVVAGGNLEEGGRVVAVVAGENLEEYINFEDFDPNNKSTCKDTECTKPEPIVPVHEILDLINSEQKHSSLYDLFLSSVDKMNIKLPAGIDLSEKKKKLTENLDRTYRKLVNNQYQYNLHNKLPFYDFINYFIERIIIDFNDSLGYCNLFDDKINKIEHFILNLFLEKIDYKNFHKNLGEVWSEYKIYEEKINELYKNIMEKAIKIFNNEKVDDSVLVKNEIQFELFNTYMREMTALVEFYDDEEYKENNKNSMVFNTFTTDFENNIKLNYGEDDFPLDAKYSKYIAKFKEILDEFLKANPNFKTSNTEKQIAEKLSELFSKIKENFDKI